MSSESSAGQSVNVNVNVVFFARSREISGIASIKVGIRLGSWFLLKLSPLVRLCRISLMQKHTKLMRKHTKRVFTHPFAAITNSIRAPNFESGLTGGFQLAIDRQCDSGEPVREFSTVPLNWAYDISSAWIGRICMTDRIGLFMIPIQWCPYHHWCARISHLLARLHEIVSAVIIAHNQEYVPVNYEVPFGALHSDLH